MVDLHNTKAKISLMSSTHERIQKIMKSFKSIGDYVKKASATNSSTCSVIAAFFIIEHKSEDSEEVHLNASEAQPNENSETRSPLLANMTSI